MDTPITINGKTPNLFRGLLSYRPRADRDSRENFLTESFAYVLAMDPAVAVRIIQAFVEDRFEVKRLKNIRTQVSLGDENGRGLPDMMLDVLDRKNRTVQVWIENKWDSCADVEQLDRYLAHLEAHEPTVRKHLVLLTPRHTDAKLCPVSSSNIALTHVSWSKIHEVVTAHRARDITNEFEQFLGAQRLAVQPITLVEARGDRKRLRENLWTLCRRVQDGLAPTELTEDVSCRDNFGRIALWMFGCRVTLGVMFDPTDHASAFVDEQRPLDLIVRIERPYTKVNAESARARLSPLVAMLEKAGFACDQGRWRSNKHTLVLGHHRDGFPFDARADEQVERLTEVFNSTQSLIVGDASLMKLLRKVKHY
ncbi:MAG: hypothetical protein ACREXP_10955 [Steroidobacteraceae bacterium]